MAAAYQHGQHVCMVYDTRHEQRAAAVAFLHEGLDHGERCLYAAGSAEELDEFCDQLNARGVDAAAAVRQGALLLLTTEQAHLIGGSFDSERMLAMLGDTLEHALDDGYIGLRTCGDMSWLLDEAPGSDQVVEYEALVNQFFHNARGLGMCQYDRARLPPRFLDHALATHATVELDGEHRINPFYRPPEIAMRRTPQPADVTWKLRTIASSPLA